MAKARAAWKRLREIEINPEEAEVHDAANGLLDLGAEQPPGTPAEAHPNTPAANPAAIQAPEQEPPDGGTVERPPKRLRGTLTALKVGRPRSQHVGKRTLDVRVKEVIQLVGGEEGALLVIGHLLKKNPGQVQPLFELLQKMDLLRDLTGSLRHEVPSEAYISDIRVSYERSSFVTCPYPPWPIALQAAAVVVTLGLSVEDYETLRRLIGHNILPTYAYGPGAALADLKAECPVQEVRSGDGQPSVWIARDFGMYLLKLQVEDRLKRGVLLPDQSGRIKLNIKLCVDGFGLQMFDINRQEPYTAGSLFVDWPDVAVNSPTHCIPVLLTARRDDPSLWQIIGKGLSTVLNETYIVVPGKDNILQEVELEMDISMDYKCLCAAYGHGGQGATHPCLCCTIDKKGLHNPENCKYIGEVFGRVPKPLDQ